MLTKAMEFDVKKEIELGFVSTMTIRSKVKIEMKIWKANSSLPDYLHFFWKSLINVVITRLFVKAKKKALQEGFNFADRTGLEPATPCVTGTYSNQLNYRSVIHLQ